MYKVSSFIIYLNSQDVREITPAKYHRLFHSSHAENYQWHSSQYMQYVMANI